MRKRRVAFLNTHPIQYFAPMYAYLNAAPDLSITALYLSDYSIRGAPDRAFGRPVKWDIDLLAGYEARFVDGAARRNESTSFLSMVAPAVWREVREGRFDALVVHGHTPAAVMVAIAAAKTAGIPVFTRSDSHLGLPCAPLKAALRRPVLGAYYRLLEGALAVGSANKAFYRAMGVPERRIFSMPYAVDNARFEAGARLSTAERTTVRRSLGVGDDHPILLYSAKFSRRKRPDDLLRAAAILRRAGAAFHVVMVGSGELSVELKTLTRSLELDNVHFAGFVNQAALPGIYAASDVFVLPSEIEPWGLAINEAMCAGLPIVISTATGCAEDLVRDEINGATFAPGDVERLAAVLSPMIEDSKLRKRMGAASREIVSNWSYAACLDGLRTALASVAR
jgi:glycosyltransferase involved in cell wall biosynthesis